MATLFGGRPCADPVTLRRACEEQGLPLDWWGTANLFRNPLGRGPGTGAVLLTKADLDALDLKTDHVLSFDDDRTAVKAVELNRITLLRARCLTPGHRDDPRAVYLCELADRRHFLAQTPVDRAFNVRDADGADYLDATTDGGDPWTWQGVVNELAGAIGLDPLPLPFTPDGDPENLRYHAADGWEALNDVLDRIACAVRLDHVADAFSIVRLGDAAAAGAAALTAALAKHDRDGLRTWDGYHVEPDRGRLPEKVRVLFPRRPVPTDGGSPYHAEDVTLAAAAGVAAGTYVQLFDDLTAVGEGVPDNAAALTARAAERAVDWRRKRLGFERRLTLVYRDFRPDLKPGETVEETSLDDHGGPMVTVLESGPDGRLEGWKPWAPPVGADQVGDPKCRGLLVGKGPDSALTGEIPAGVGKCANVGPETVYLAHDADLVAPGIGYWGGWVSTPFQTRQGDTTAAVYLDDRGNPTAWLSSAAGSGGAVERPMTWLGCDSRGRMRFVTFDCAWCDDFWAGPCAPNQFELLVSCGALACGGKVPLPPLIDYRVEHLFNDSGTLRLGSNGGGPPWVAGVTAGRAPFWGCWVPGANDPFGFVTDGYFVALFDEPWGDGCMRLEFWGTAEHYDYVPFMLVRYGIGFPGGGFPAVVYGGDPDLDLLRLTDGTARGPAGDDLDLCGDPLLPPCAACYDGAGEPLDGHPGLPLDVPDGVVAGSYSLTWTGTYWSLEADIEGNAHEWRLSCAGGVWTLALYKAGELRFSGTATAQSCRPFGLVFAAADFEATGDLTVSLAA